MNYNPEKYGALLAATLPSVIDSESEYERLLEVVNHLMNKGEDNLSPEEERLLVLLSNLISEYENRVFPELQDSSSPHEILRFLMEANGLRQKDLLDIFGSDGVASEVFNGKRSISKTQAKKLAEKFRVSVELFI